MKRHAAYYLALEKWLLDHGGSNQYFFTWDIFPTIVCGKHQLLETEVNLDYLKKIGVELTRRHSGGGTVFADEGDFMFSFIKRSGRKDEVFGESLSEIADMLKSMGVEAERSGRNDLLFKGKKFSGNAYYRNENGWILHGTMMYDVDVEKLVRALTPDNEKLISKGIESVRQRVINLKPYLGGRTREEVMTEFERQMSSKYIIPEMDERDEILSIEREYESDAWIWGNNPPYTFSNRKRFDWGLIEVRADVKGGVVKSMNMTGDFFCHKDVAELCGKFVGTRFTKDEMAKVIDGLNVGEWIVGGRNCDILELF